MRGELMNKYFLILVLIGSLIIFPACVSNKADQQTTYTPTTPTQQTTNTVPDKVNTVKIEIFHFHPKVQCVSCKTLGIYAEETINKYYSKELKNGKITFSHINYELPENQDLVLLYRPPGSALCIGVYDDKGNLYTEENYGVWYRLDNKDNFMSYMKQLVDMRLNGYLTKI